MKKVLLSILAAAALTGFAGVQTTEAASSMFTVGRYPQASEKGWPKWIGRLEHMVFVRYERPELSPQYLPLSLIRTGRFEEMVNEILETPNVDSTTFPEWIGN